MTSPVGVTPEDAVLEVLTAHGVGTFCGSRLSTAIVAAIRSWDAETQAALIGGEVEWAEGQPSDGTHEHVTTADCDGSNPREWSRSPAIHKAATPWGPIS